FLVALARVREGVHDRGLRATVRGEHRYLLADLVDGQREAGRVGLRGQRDVVAIVSQRARFERQLDVADLQQRAAAVLRLQQHLQRLAFPVGVEAVGYGA